MKKNIIPLFLGIAFWCVSPSLSAKITHLLPRPQSVTLLPGNQPFALGRPVCVMSSTPCRLLHQFLQEQGCMEDSTASAKIIVERAIRITGAWNHPLSDFPDESYTLRVTSDTVLISAATETGVKRAVQTLSQMAEGWDGMPALESLEMTDWPAFKLRGFMHDVGRSFITFEELKKEITLLSRFKVNVFHFHLTENQAWRFEVKAFPALTAASSMTRFQGSFYTQAQCLELDSLAQELGVIIIPEIDMPGHSGAWERAMGHSMQTAQGVEELKTVLEEVASAFPHSPYLHIGADEQQITYSGFLKIMTDKVHSLGRKVVAWNPIRGVTITKDTGFDMTQMWSTAGKKITGLPNIDCRYNYTNHFDVFADLVGIYKSNIYYQDKGSADVAGFISAAWNDRKTPTQEDIIRQNNVYANILASTERAWIGGGKQYIETGGTMLPNSGAEYDEFADWERRFLFHKNHSLRGEPIAYVRQSNVRWRVTDAFPNGGNASLALPPETEGLKESYSYDGADYGTGLATGAGIYLRHTWGGTVPTYFKNPQTNTTAYAWTYVYSPTAREAGALVEFQNYGRSENDQAPVQGRWDRKGSRLYVNDAEVLPPSWSNAGKSINAEVPLGNENLTARPPVRLTLHEGWNKVLMKLPYNPEGGVRLQKWMFTFVLTDVDGRDALDDVTYSPDRRMDGAADQVAAALATARQARSSVVRPMPGYWPELAAADLDAVLRSVEATLGETLSAEERARQLQDVEAATATFLRSYSQTDVLQPLSSTSAASYGYRLLTPLRESRYVTDKGAGAALVGETQPTDESVWTFVERGDGTKDIVNLSTGRYLSPSGNFNAALTSVTARPSKGWTLSKANEPGYMIITSGTVQLNQTNTGLQSKIYNWGGGSNITDSGCKYRIEPVGDYTSVGIGRVSLSSVVRVEGGRIVCPLPFRVYDAMGSSVPCRALLSPGVYLVRTCRGTEKVVVR